MRILVNAGTLRGAGSERVGRGLLGEFSERPGRHEFAAFVPNEWCWRSTPGFRVLGTRPGLAAKFLRESISVRRELGSKCDVLLSLGDTSTPRPGKPHCLFVQQAYLAYPEVEWGFEPPPRFRRRMQLMAAYFRAGLRWVDRFVVQTHDMQEKLCRRWQLSSARVAVIPSAVGADTLEEAARPREDAVAPRLTYIAGPAPHKNHVVLPKMLASLRDGDATLSVTVRRGDLPEFDREVVRHGVAERVRYLGMISRTVMFEELRSSHLTVMPSLLESFGLGYYEALALGVPIVSADLGFAREACGGAALYASPGDAGSYAAQVDQLLGSTSLRHALSDAGRARFAQNTRSWSQVANEFIRQLENCA